MLSFVVARVRLVGVVFGLRSQFIVSLFLIRGNARYLAKKKAQSEAYLETNTIDAHTRILTLIGSSPFRFRI